MEKKDLFDKNSETGATSQAKAQPIVIGTGTTIIGDIFSTGIVEIQGEVKGNVSTTEDLEVSGRIEGDIKGKNVLLNKAAIKGKIDAENDAEMNDCVILGDVHASNIILDSKLKGKLFAKEKVELASGAVLVGDVNSRTIGIDMGAKIKGQIVTKEMDFNENDFDFEISPPEKMPKPKDRGFDPAPLQDKKPETPDLLAGIPEKKTEGEEEKK